MLYTTGIGTNAHHRLSVCRFVRSIFGTGMVSTCTTAIVIDQGGGTDHPSSEDRIGSGVTDPDVGALESESGEKMPVSPSTGDAARISTKSNRRLRCLPTDVLKLEFF